MKSAICSVLVLLLGTTQSMAATSKVVCKTADGWYSSGSESANIATVKINQAIAAAQKGNPETQISPPSIAYLGDQYHVLATTICVLVTTP